MTDYDSLSHRLWYGYWRGLCRIVGISAFGIRCFQRQHVPAQGGALLACNHQSFLDPMVAALGLRRQVHFMARDSLFHRPGFGWLIRSVNAFPLKRHRSDLGAIKEALRRLKAGQLLLLFGEGTRSYDGSIGPLQPGTAMIARRAGVPLVPVVIDGAFDAWPRDRKMFRCCTIRVIYGQPVTVRQINSLSNKGVANIIYRHQQELQHILRRRYGRKPYSYPALEVGP